ncbi:hypothetical protein GCM10022380_33760 [Amycolatopsis tucumanensis]|uniref:Uncharacterized protein n=1 Tax=Amycolatopsis tucumanensis TaxID=401106 RepID=A0ABP7I9X5_9PSEU
MARAATQPSIVRPRNKVITTMAPRATTPSVLLINSRLGSGAGRAHPLLRPAATRLSVVRSGNGHRKLECASSPAPGRLPSWNVTSSRASRIPTIPSRRPSGTPR